MARCNFEWDVGSMFMDVSVRTFVAPGAARLFAGPGVGAPALRLLQ